MPPVSARSNIAFLFITFTNLSLWRTLSNSLRDASLRIVSFPDPHTLLHLVTLASKSKVIRAITSNLRGILSDSLLPKHLWTNKSTGGRFDRRSTNMEIESPVSTSAGESKPKEDKVEKSYLSGALESMSAWGGPSRSSTPKPGNPVTAPGEGSGLKNQHGGDRHTQHYGLSSKRYPSDCPPLNARWFYAVDVNQAKSTATFYCLTTQANMWYNRCQNANRRF